MRMHRLGIALTIANLVLLLVVLTQTRTVGAPSTASVLRGQVLELVDERGQVRSRLNVEPGGAVVFRLMDQTGTIRVKLGADKDGSGLLLNNDATEPGVHILAKDTGSTLKLRNKDGQERLVKP